MYAWLYRNDKDWLNENSPVFKSMTSNNKRVDWHQRDKEIAKEIIQTVINILTKDMPRRVNTSAIGKAIGKLSILEKHIENLPRTNFILNESTESIEEFQKRRVVWVVNQLKSQGESLDIWKIKRLAGLKNNVSSEILNTIEKIKETLDD